MQRAPCLRYIGEDMNWLSDEQKRAGVPVCATMAVGGRALRLTPHALETVGCAGGSETLVDGDETLDADRRLPGLQAFVNLGAVLLAWLNENHDILPEGKTAGDIATRASLSSAGSRRCYLMAEVPDSICVRWFGFVFHCNSETMTSQQGAEETAQSWADRAQYVLDFYAAHGITPMGAE